MKLYLASVLHDYCTGIIEDINTYVLESFYNMEKRYYPLLSDSKDLLIDSGIFYYNTNRKRTDFISYCDSYIDFLNAHGIDKFFEMDVDSIEGFEKAKMYTKRIETGTGKPVIPIWHINRGIDNYKGICRDYDYIAIGLTSTKEIKAKEYNKLIPLIDYAHSKGTKVHGLGFTALKWMPKLKFDSVDSSSWSAGRRYGVIWGFDTKKGEMRQTRPKLKNWDWREITKHNYTQWRKYQKYVYSHY